MSNEREITEEVKEFLQLKGVSLGFFSSYLFYVAYNSAWYLQAELETFGESPGKKRSMK